MILDQGSTLHKLVVFDEAGSVVETFSAPGPGLSESPFGLGFCAEELGIVSDDLIARALEKYGRRMASFGFANQGESVVAWSRSTGKPLAPCISWQCQKSAPILDEITPHHEKIRELTGLVPSAYFSAPKMAWLLRHAPQVREAAQSGDLALGTLDSWMIWRWTGGKYLVTDPTTACRTMLYDLSRGGWSDDLLRLFEVPRAALAQIAGNTDFQIPLQHGPFALSPLHLRASLCDQPAGLIGHGGLLRPTLKICFGTGAFVDLSLPEGSLPENVPGLLTSILFAPAPARPCYYVEGGVLGFGSLLDHTKLETGVDILKRLESAPIDELYRDTGIFCVPAFAGLGAPYFQSRVRTHYSGTAAQSLPVDIALATLQALVFRVAEIVSVMAEKFSLPAKILVDGGLSRHPVLMQMLADVLNRTIQPADDCEITARGVENIIRRKMTQAMTHSARESTSSTDIPPLTQSYTPYPERISGLLPRWNQEMKSFVSWFS